MIISALLCSILVDYEQGHLMPEANKAMALGRHSLRGAKFVENKFFEKRF